MLSPKDEAPLLSQSITTTIPHNAYKVMVAPAGEQWWRAASSMVQASTAVSNLNLSAAPVDPVAVGYFEYPGATGGTELSAHRVLAVEAATEDDAEDLIRWFDTQSGAEGRNGSLVGKVVTLQSSSHMPLEAIDKPWSAPAAFAPKASEGTMWIDLTLLAEAQVRSATTGSVASTVLPALLGFTPGSSSVLDSEDGRKWSGKWVSGGFDQSLINFEAADKALAATSDRYASEDFEEQTEGGRSPSVEIEAEGPMDFLNNARFSDHETEQSYGGLETGLIDSSGAAKGEATGLWDQRQFSFYFGGASWLPETNKHVAYGLSEETLEISFH